MKWIFLPIYMLVSLVSGAQARIINQSVTDSSLNIFYIGVENYIQVKDRDIAGYSISIKGVKSSINDLGNGRYTVRLYSPDSCIVTVLNKKRKTILSKKYSIETIPTLKVGLSGRRDTIMKKEQILVNPFIAVGFPNFYYRHLIEVTSFETEFVMKDDSIKTAVSNRNMFSEDQIKIIKELNSGDKIYFENIYGVNADGRRSKLPGFWIMIE